MSQFRTFIELLKIKYWIKNFLILIPIFFATIIPDYSMVLELIMLFFIFSLSASTIYIFNDIIDKDRDKINLTKKNRPIASGQITLKNSILISLVLLAILIMVLIIAKSNVLNLLIISYFLVSFIYSFVFKKYFFIDVCTLSIFYILRVLTPIYYFNLNFSYWLILIIFVSVLLVGFGKRYMDINNNLSNNGFVSIYTKKQLIYLILVSAIILQILYVFFSFSDGSISRYGENFYITGIITFLGISRYLYSLFKLNFTDPVEIFIKDKYFIFILMTYLAFNIFLIYIFL